MVARFRRFLGIMGNKLAILIRRNECTKYCRTESLDEILILSLTLNIDLVFRCFSNSYTVFLISNAFFNSASVLLNFFMN